MNNLKYAEIQEALNHANLSDCPKLNLTILRNIMLEPIEPYLQYLGYQSGFNCDVRFGEYDNIFQETIAESDVFHAETDCVLIFMILDVLSWGLSRNFSSMNDSQVQDEIHRIQEYFEVIIQGIRRQTNAMILWHAIELPVHPNLGIRDSQIDDGQLASIRSLNELLRGKLQATPNSYYVDTNLCMARIGSENFYDLRYWHIGRAPYTRGALSAIAEEDFKFIRSLKGKNKKCLVLDCDNTLWGGILGEDGLEGIKLGKTHPGSAFYEFQQEIVNLYHRGVILALCSKNNEEDVWKVFHDHPDMLLKEHHIAASQINWQDKVTNLRQIAIELNIGLDSMVFMDDSAFEINLVRQELPEVESILMPVKLPVKYRTMLASSGLFDTLTISEEDKKRGMMYKAEASRKKLQAQVTDMASYYHSLEMVVDIQFADDFSIPRIAQLTQKTNQFNLTTRRYNEAEIKRFSDAADSEVLYVKLADKIGDSGIVGACVLQYHETHAVIDTLLLSCRVLGRSLENIFLNQILELTKKHGYTTVIGEYYATQKNAQVASFYAQHHFNEMDPESGPPDRKFLFHLNQEIPPSPQHFKTINSPIKI
jgi:FkbH-like protein